MPDEPLPPPIPVKRPPVPGWMWALFALAWIPLGALIGLMIVYPDQSSMGAGIGMGAVSGLFLAVPMTAGLALAARFFTGTAGRIMGGLMFAVLFTVGVVAVVFAGCMCLNGTPNFH